MWSSRAISACERLPTANSRAARRRRSCMAAKPRRGALDRVMPDSLLLYARGCHYYARFCKLACELEKACAFRVDCEPDGRIAFVTRHFTQYIFLLPSAPGVMEHDPAECHVSVKTDIGQTCVSALGIPNVFWRGISRPPIPSLCGESCTLIATALLSACRP